MTDSTTPAPGPASDRSRVRRMAEKAVYDRDVIDAILDEGLVGHLGLVADDGAPVVIPTAYARDGDRVLIHGSAASRMIRAGAGGAAVSFAVTLLDAIVVARSLFESSMAYRSVVVHGTAIPIDDPDEKLAALLALSDRLIPGRVAEARGPSPKELAATRVFAIDLAESAAKVSGTSIDDGDEDRALPVWAGHIPLRVTRGDAISEPGLDPGIAVPRSVADWSTRDGAT